MSCNSVLRPAVSFSSFKTQFAARAMVWVWHACFKLWCAEQKTLIDSCSNSILKCRYFFRNIFFSFSLEHENSICVFSSDVKCTKNFALKNRGYYTSSILQSPKYSRWVQHYFRTNCQQIMILNFTWVCGDKVLNDTVRNYVRT